MRRVLAGLVMAFAVVHGTGDAQTAPPKLIAPGVWFLLGDREKGYSNTAIIEMKDYLIVVDANFPGRAKELLLEVPKLSPKPVKYVFITHAHGDHSYGNSTWTKAGATTVAYLGMLSEMDRYEPERWKMYEGRRDDVRDLHESTVERPKQTFGKEGMVLKDATREVRLLYLGWGHTPADGYVWLPKERILCTGDAAVNGPRNKLWDANLANWPKALTTAIAMRPAWVLPGHGDAGGVEILVGQRRFLVDLYNIVAAQAARHIIPTAATVHMPTEDKNWVLPDMSQDIEITYSEIANHQPAGALPHPWK